MKKKHLLTKIRLNKRTIGHLNLDEMKYTYGRGASERTDNAMVKMVTPLLAWTCDHCETGNEACHWLAENDPFVDIK